MNDREYLRSMGFRVGERGRFSAEMLASLAERNMIEIRESLDWTNESVGIVSRTPVREARELCGMTKDGYVVAFVMCSECAEHMSWCECPNGVLAPDNVATLMGVGKTIARIHPRMVQLMTTH